ncbi:MAG: carboxypeptidase-like regulatory domain-containing protein [Gaiellaceae bacterium]
MAARIRTLVPALAALSLLFVGSAHTAALSTPSPLTPAGGAVVESLPGFAWSPVANADHYEFQFAADAGFNSPVLGQGEDQFTTRNTRATLQKTVPNGTYWWRVRAVDANGGVSAWSVGREVVKRWSAAGAIQSPPGGSSLTYPSNPVVLSWSPVAGAAQYFVSVASDPTLGSLVLKYQNQDNPSGPPSVAATNAAITAALAPGSYYWSVTPVDAEGNRGAPSPVASFNWSWPSTTTARVTDLNPAGEVYDPQFSWDPVPGAVRYEVEINSTSYFAPGSKVCCSGTTIATSLSPTVLFQDNVYYWRVRALDPDGNAGVWNYGPSFNKAFDKASASPPPAPTAVTNLHMRDNVTDDTITADVDHDLSNGFQTTTPVVSWNPVPGASSYLVEIGTATGDPLDPCDFSSPVLTATTSVTAWTPLSQRAFTIPQPNPFPSFTSVAEDTFPTLVPGTYCFRVRARSDRAGFTEVYGDPTYLGPDGKTDWNTPNGPAFTWTGYPSGSSPGCLSGYLCASDYLTPVTGSSVGMTPLITWKAMAGAGSYFVAIAKDDHFSNIVDEGFTQIPAYAPRNSLTPTTYADETTSYYWIVLPSPNPDGTGVKTFSLAAALGNFQKQSTPPLLISPANGTAFLDQPTFRWSAATGARKYELQVAQDPTFGNPIDDVTTDATSYSSNSTYPADTVLYWRVRASDENGIGLTWSDTGTFQKKLATPVPSPNNPTSGDALPVWSWSPIQGASSYDIAIDQPNGQTREFDGMRAPVGSFIKMTGTGVWHWRVRAEFPKQSFGSTPGPWSASTAFTRTIGEPGGLHTDSNPDHVLLSWNSKFGIKNYKVQISSRPDFSTTIENVTTDNTSYAPRLLDIGYLNGGALFWRVAGVDADSNVGDFSPAQSISLLPQLKLRVTGKLRRRRWATVTVYVSKPSGLSLAGAAVRIGGSGVKTRTTTTNRYGSVTFKLRPTRMGRVLLTVRKAGYQGAARVLLVKR